jgi:hypothetical protein
MLKFERDGSCGPIEISFKEAIERWWYNITCIFHITFGIGLMGLTIRVCILGNELKLDIALPYRPIYFPRILNDMFSWVATTNLSKDKALEIQISPNNDLSLCIDICKSIHMSHAGFLCEFNFILFSLYISIYDGRHWDYENNKWEAYDD